MEIISVKIPRNTNKPLLPLRQPTLVIKNTNGPKPEGSPATNLILGTLLSDNCAERQIEEAMENKSFLVNKPSRKCYFGTAE